MRYLAARRGHGLLWLLVTAVLLLATMPGVAQADPQQALASVLASLSVTAPACSQPILSQPFAAWNDFAYYTPVPGQSVPNFTAAGWILQGAAGVRSTALANGATGQVLDLKSGSFAISPPVCVDLDYPTARLMVRNVTGGGGVHAFVSYAGPTSWGKPRDGGSAHGKDGAWALSDPIHLQPGHAPGWQLVRFGLLPDGRNSEFQIYNFYIDPYARG